MLADANVPWHGGKGPGGELFKADPGGDDTLLLTALDPKSRFRAKSRTAPPVLAAAEAGSANVVPIPKPATLALADAADAQIIPALTEDTPIIEALQHDPLQSPPLRLSQGPVLRMDSAVTELAQGDGSDSSPAPVERQANDGVVKRWAVQIGAFASEALAQAKLATFAQRGFDIIGQAQKLIVPFTSGSGQILYRARLGMFGESEARDICRRMTQRGESCFAALSDAG